MGLFDKLFKKDGLVLDSNEDKSTVKEESCGCGGSCEVDSIETEPIITSNNHLTIKILGSGCKNCVTLTENVKLALDEMNLKANVVKVTDLGEITGYGVMSTPAIVVNEKVVSYGKVLKPNEVVKIFEKILD